MEHRPTHHTARKGRRTPLAAVAAALLVVAACGSGDRGTAGSATQPTSEATATTVTTTDTSPAPTTTEPEPGPSTTEEAASIDWANLTYEIECGAAQELPLIDGLFEPEEFNSPFEVLRVELEAAVPIPTRPDVVLVHLGCAAGGATGALSGELYALMSAPAGATEPTMLVAVIAEPSATLTVTDDGMIVIDDLTYAASDPNCCPSLTRSRHIVWDNGTPTVVEGPRPETAPADGPSAAPTDGCIATELNPDVADPADVTLLEQALSAAGFGPGPVDGIYDDALVEAVVRFIEFNADNPALHTRSADAPYDNLHAEARVHRTVRTPVLTTLEIACPTVTPLPRN